MYTHEAAKPATSRLLGDVFTKRAWNRSGLIDRGRRVKTKPCIVYVEVVQVVKQTGVKHMTGLDHEMNKFKCLHWALPPLV